MKHKQSIILVFFVVFSFLFVNFSLFSMEEDEYYMDNSIDGSYSSFAMQCITNSGLACHSTGSKHINRDYLYVNSNSKAYQDQLDGVSCILSKENNKFPVVVVNNYLKISINGDNTLKFITEKESRYYPLQFLISPNTYPVCNQIEPYTLEDHPFGEQEEFYKKNEESIHTKDWYIGPFRNRAYQEIFLRHTKKNICPISFITNKPYSQSPSTYDLFSSIYLFLHVLIEKEKNTIKSKVIETKYNNTIPIKEFNLTEEKKSSIADQAEQKNRNYWYELCLKFYNNATKK